MDGNSLDITNSLLLIIDIQGKLFKSQLYHDLLVKNASILARAAGILNIPVVVTEQYPEGLGATIDEIKNSLPKDTKFFEKKAFSCCRQEGFNKLLEGFGNKHIIVCGIEAHVCVYQTVADLISLGYKVNLVKDAVSSRKESDFNIGVERMLNDGALLASTEMILFELLQKSSHPSFKEVQALIK